MCMGVSFGLPQERNKTSIIPTRYLPKIVKEIFYSGTEQEAVL
jgi:hypothetical protein